MEVMAEVKKMLSQQEVLNKGTAIYEQIKDQYEPEHKGKFLVIDIETGKTYMSDKAALAIEMADMDCPDSQCYVLRIGYEAAFTLY